MIRITTAPPVQADNPFVQEFQKSRLTLLMNLAAMEGLYFRDRYGSASQYNSYTNGMLEIEVPMEDHKEQFKMNYFLCAVMDLRLLDYLTFNYDTSYEKEWVQDFLQKYWELEYPKLVPTEA